MKIITETLEENLNVCTMEGLVFRIGKNVTSLSKDMVHELL